MMREEFERLIGCHVDCYEYSVIEEVYMNLDLIRSKQHIASIYLRHGMSAMYELRNLVRGNIHRNVDLRRCAKILAKKEIQLPNHAYKIILWYNVTTGELYDCTITALFRYAKLSRCWTWVPYTLTRTQRKRKLNSVLCDIAMHHPRLYRPCSAIARKFCYE